MLDFVAVPSTPPEQVERNRLHASTLGLPTIERSGHVAVVGGGQSLADHLQEIRGWDGPIWAINQTFMFLKSQGIRATFFTADAKDQPWLEVEDGDSAIVGLHGDPKLFERLKRAHVRTYRLDDDEVHCGPTTASAAPHLAMLTGHKTVTFFGCESSFGEGTHVYSSEVPGDLIRVECGGASFLTKPEFLLQAEVLAAFCREIPENCAERSGGLLRALIENPEREVVGIPKWMAESLAA